jgi:hypoxanthine phosphoribosyltransferase
VRDATPPEFRCFRGDRPPRFASPAELLCARLFEFYELAWLYEPTTFPLRWDDQGRVSEAVTPDFYLVDLDVYLEITTMRQAHITRKARKLRALAEQYPDVRVKLFVRRDIERLAQRHGLALEADAA